MTGRRSNEEVSPDLLESFVKLDETLRQGDATVADKWLQEHPQREFGTARKILQTLQSRGNPSSDVDPEEPFPRKFGRYEILRQLGNGAMGAVYLARDTQLGRDVAIKLPILPDSEQEEALARFYREARAAALLRNSHLCPVYDVGEIDGQHYISMAFIAGESLKEQLGKQHSADQPMSLHWILNLMRKLASALADAHEQGIIHRDLKPANIMIDRKGEPVIMDFGLARLANQEEEQLTKSGMIVGTPVYMSPEQVSADYGEIDQRTDIYALGVILYELLTGQLPYRGSLMSILQQIAVGHPKRPGELRPQLDADVEALCLKMMAADPLQRPPTMHAVAEESASILNRRSAGGSSIAPSQSTRLHSAQQRATAQVRPAVSGAAANKVRFAWIVMAGGAVLSVLVAIVLLIQTPQGTLRVEIFDPETMVIVSGSDVILKSGHDEPVTLQAGEHTLHIQRGDLDFVTPSFEIKRKEQAVARVEVTDKGIATSLNEKILNVTPLAVTGSWYPDDDNPEIDFAAERRAAEWVKSVGGTLELATESGPIPSDPLPDQNFYLTAVRFDSKPQINDQSLATLSRCRRLRAFYLTYNSSVSDDGITCLSRFNPLEFFDCRSVSLGDGTCLYLKQFPKLAAVHLVKSRMTDKGLSEIATLPRLNSLFIGGSSNLTADGLAKLPPIGNLLEFDCGNSIWLTESALRNFLAANRLLQNVSIQFDAPSPQGDPILLNALQGHPHVRTIGSDSRRILAVDVQVFDTLPEFQNLDCIGRIDDFTLEKLALIRPLKRLGIFVHADAEVKTTAHGWRTLAGHSKLERVSIHLHGSQCELSNVILRELVNCKSLNSLEMGLNSTSAPPNQTLVEAFKMSRPDVSLKLQ